MLANKFNESINRSHKISSKQGVTCSSPSLMTGGSPYGVTNDSLNADVESGLGKARASVSNHYTHCNSQKGGAAGHNYDADAVGQTYGYTKAGAAIAGELRGSYAPSYQLHQKPICVVVKRKDVEKINLENHVENRKKGGRRRKRRFKNEYHEDR